MYATELAEDQTWQTTIKILQHDRPFYLQDFPEFRRGHTLSYLAELRTNPATYRKEQVDGFFYLAHMLADVSEYQDRSALKHAHQLADALIQQLQPSDATRALLAADVAVLLQRLAPGPERQFCSRCGFRH